MQQALINSLNSSTEVMTGLLQLLASNCAPPPAPPPSPMSMPHSQSFTDQLQSDTTYDPQAYYQFENSHWMIVIEFAAYNFLLNRVSIVYINLEVYHNMTIDLL